MTAKLEAILRMDDEALRNALVANARAVAHEAAELDPEDRGRLVGVLQQIWPEGGFGAAFSRRANEISASDPGAFAWLFLGPALDADITPAQWADIATSGVVMTQTAEWLRAHYSDEAAATAAETNRADGARTWAQLVESIPSTRHVPDEVLVAMVKNLHTPTENEPDFELWQIGQRLAEEGQLSTLQALSANGDDIALRLLPWRARLGEVKAGRVLLEEMVAALKQRARVDRTDAEWLEGVCDSDLLELLFSALAEEVRSERDDPFGARGGLQRAIQRIGGEEAVRRYDELIESSDESGFKFLRLSRDELVQSELRTAGQSRAQEIAERIGVPSVAPGEP